MGRDGFSWFAGVVEDRQDPLKLGRVRVRCLGYHTEDLTKLPTADLPWAHPMNPITSATVSGVGQTPLGSVEGTWVIGFFHDGADCQQPIIIGPLPGVPYALPDNESRQDFKTLTSPKIGTSILDTNGNELFLLTATSSAVNQLTYANAATGNKPTLTASGDDSNIGISIQPKGTGTITIDALTFPAGDGTSGQVLQTDGSGNLSFATASSGITTGKAIAMAIVFG